MLEQSGVEQSVPVQPISQLQTSGDTHDPPFWQPKWFKEFTENQKRIVDASASFRLKRINAFSNLISPPMLVQSATEQFVPSHPLSHVQVEGAVQDPALWQPPIEEQSGVAQITPSQPVGQVQTPTAVQVPPFRHPPTPEQSGTVQSTPIQPVSQAHTSGEVQVPPF